MNTTSLRSLIVVSLVLALSLLIPSAAHATAFTWTGGVNTTWAQTTSPYDWSGGSSTNGRYPGMTHTTYTDTATITSTTNNPVTLASAITLGGTSPCLTLSGASNSLVINNGGTVGAMSDITNFGTITLNTGGSLKDGATSSGTQYVLGLSSATGNITLAGGAISSLGGTWVTEQPISGYGTISAPMINFTGGVITANDNVTGLNITGVFANGTSSIHNGTVNVGTSVGSPAGTLTIGTGGTFTNYSALNIYGTFNNNTATTVTLAGTGGTATLAGGTLGGTGTFTNTATLSAYGNITANLLNSTATTSTINAAGNITVSDITLTNSGNTSHGINLGAYTLDHSTAGTFALAGGGYTTLAGGAITNSGGGTMTNANQLRGYGTISAPLATNSGGITANTASQTLTVTGNIASDTGGFSATAGTLLLKSTISGQFSIVAANSGAEVDLNGADLVGPTAFFNYITLGSSSNGSGPINLTGNSTWENRFQVNSVAPLNVNGYTLTLVNFTGSLPSGTFLNVGTGNLNISGPAGINSGGYIKLGGGNVIGNNVSNTLAGNVTGYGDITAELVGTGGLATATGGTLYIDGGAILNNGSTNSSMASSSTGVLDIRSTISNPFNAFVMTSYISPSGGTVNLDGATLTTTGADAILLNTGTVNVTNNSTFTGNITSNSTLGINSGKTLTLTGATVSLATGSSLNNSGTLAVGASTVTNTISPATDYTLGGGGAVTLAGGSFTSTGGGGFVSSNVVSGTGNVSANWTQTGAASSTSGTIAFTGNVLVNGGTFQGNHTIVGNLTTGVGSNAVLATHNGATANTMTVTGNVTLDHSTVLNYNLGAPTTVGGGVNDLLAITGNLSLDGTLNVTGLTGFAAGTYTLMTYTGSLSGAGLTLNTVPDSTLTYAIDTTVANHVNLNVTAAQTWAPGDTNYDNAVNSLDVDWIYQNLTVLPPGFTGWAGVGGNQPWPRSQAAYLAQCDVNHDGVVNQDDVTYELNTYFHTSYGDATLDKATDFLDFQALLDHWQNSGASIGWAQADFNGDGVVDFLDFQNLLDYWNPNGWNFAPAQTPEPASVSLILLGGMALLRRSRKA